MKHPDSVFALFVVFGCVLLGLSTGCRSFDPSRPLAGAPRIVTERASFWVWTEGNRWRIRMSSGKKSHRFQGSLSGVNGGIGELSTTDDNLKDRVELLGDSVQFDFESDVKNAVRGFDVEVMGGCVRFDLLLDGVRRPRGVRLGPRGAVPNHIPFQRCRD